ncbi:VOC family protein [Rhizorhabdus argentea]|uniref:hypothetical protein n=1 Tax=Rhizorhabdus argentea TaxID=1387174 RepID=UPI0030ED8F8C
MLPVIGLRLLADCGSSLDYGVGAILLSVETPTDGQASAPGNGIHIAFAADDRAMVDRFHTVGWPMAAAMQVLRARVPNMTRIIMGRSCAIPMETRSRSSPIRRIDAYSAVILTVPINPLR